MFCAKTNLGYEISMPKVFHQYEIQKLIGNGSTSIVVLVESQVNHKRYAAKIASIRDNQKSHFLKYVENEITILKTLDHPHIIKLIDTFHFENQNKEDFIILIMEFCKYGSLRNFIGNFGCRDKNQLKVLFIQILDAIKYLHHKNISHMDLKEDNILIDAEFNVKLCDFGFAQTKSEVGDESKIGTLYYSAPEILVPGKFNPIEADIYALGVTLFSATVKRYPYKKGSRQSIINQTLKGRLSFSHCFDLKLRKLVKKCTRVKADKRPNIDEIIADPYFKVIKAKQ